MGIDWSIALPIVALVVLVTALEVLIAVIYKRRTGKDMAGARFWKSVFARFRPRSSQ